MSPRACIMRLVRLFPKSRFGVALFVSAHMFSAAFCKAVMKQMENVPDGTVQAHDILLVGLACSQVNSQASNIGEAELLPQAVFLSDLIDCMQHAADAWSL